MSKTTNSALTVNVPSFDEILSRLGDEKKMAEAKKSTLRIQKEAKLSALMKTAKVNLVLAEAGLAEALLSEHSDEAAAVKAVIDAQKTFEFYEAIYSVLFPNG